MQNTQLSKKLKISETAIRKRLKRLFDKEMIQVVAIVNHRKFGYNIDGVITVEPSFRLQLVKNRYDWETPKAGATPT